MVMKLLVGIVITIVIMLAAGYLSMMFADGTGILERKMMNMPKIVRNIIWGLIWIAVFCLMALAALYSA